MDDYGTFPPSESARRAIARVLGSSEPSDMPRPERVLWAFCQRTLSVAARDDLADLPYRLDEAMWLHLLALAQMHGVAPLAFRHLAQADLLGSIPDPVAGALKEAYLQTLINNRRMQTVFKEVVGALRAEGISVMPIKGLAVAHRYYGDIALRPMTDMDLLVSRQDVPRVVSVLRGLHFNATDGMGSPSGFYALTSAVVVFSRPRSLSIEVHWELCGRHAYRPSLPAAAAWDRAVETTLFDQPVRSLHQRDEIWYLCVHAAIEHRLERLIWLVDIAEIASSLPADWDWRQFARETCDVGLALPVAAALAYCCSYLHTAVPTDALDVLYAAAGAPSEQKRLAAARADLLTADWIRDAALSVRGPKETAIFVRGVLAPRLATLVTLYGRDAARWHALPGTYVRHMWRTAAPTLRVLGAGMVR
jgi:hypothetical protein